MHRQADVEFVAEFAVGGIFVRIADAVERIEAGIGNVDAIGYAVNRAVGVGDIVVSHIQPRRPAKARAVIVGLIIGRAFIGSEPFNFDIAQMMFAAKLAHDVAMRFLFVGRGYRGAATGNVKSVGIGRIDRDRAPRPVEAADGQEFLHDLFLIPCGIGAQIDAVVVIRRKVDRRRITKALTVIAIAAQLLTADHFVLVGRTRQDRRIIDIIADLDIIKPATIVVFVLGEHEMHQLVAIGIGAERAADDDFFIQVGGFAFGFVAFAQCPFQKEMIVRQRRTRAQFDAAAQAFRIVIGQAGLGNDDPVDRPGRDRVEFHRAACAGKRRAAGIGVEQRGAAKAGPVQIAIQPANVDEPPFARVNRQENPGNAAQCLGSVVIRIFGNRFSRLDIDHVRRDFLRFARSRFQPGGGYDDRTGSIIRLCRGGHLLCLRSVRQDHQTCSGQNPCMQKL